MIKKLTKEQFIKLVNERVDRKVNKILKEGWEDTMSSLEDMANNPFDISRYNDEKEESLTGVKELVHNKIQELVDEISNQFGDETTGRYAYDIKNMIEEEAENLLHEEG